MSSDVLTDFSKGSKGVVEVLAEFGSGLPCFCDNIRLWSNDGQWGPLSKLYIVALLMDESQIYWKPLHPWICFAFAYILQLGTPDLLACRLRLDNCLCYWLSFYTTEKGLSQAFSQYGHVVQATIVMDKVSDRSKGFGFVTFASADEAGKPSQK
ncbi:hypothetical protein RJ639_018514 [Escallonia herrerae]|uniref:RRM domain-containing protein n=1 Tax=Escallonia herrerae TaxID=1293975 RepID=A0AA88V925_9ASTE|nr:hypothetical protein RJ639_018514 [Escallonia herrerae]